MAQTRLESDLFVNGNLYATSMTLPASAVVDSNVASNAAIDAGKLEHQYEVVYSQDSTTDATVERKVIHIVRGATGDIVAFAAGSVSIASGGGNAVVDLLKNGTTVLSAAITLDSTNTAYVLESAGGFSSTALVAGDVLEFKLTSASATKPKGVFCRLVVRELAD